MSNPDEARELSLISKVELRIALADSDSKLQSLLQTYLAPLLLKLASESLAVRNKVIAVCQHINTRIRPVSITLPVAALLKQFKEVKAPLVRHFDLIYIKQGLDRIPASERIELIPALIQGIAGIGGSISASSHGSVVFNLLLRLLPLLKLPQRGSEDDLALRAKLGISDEDATFLAKWFAKVFLLLPAGKDATRCPGLTPSEYRFVNRDASPDDTWNPSAAGGLNLIETKVAAAKFLASGAFTDSERFLAAVIASADPNSRLSDVGEDILKRFRADLENAEVVDELFTLYFGTKDPDGALPARPALQAKILGFLSKSVKATTQPERINQLLDEGLFSNNESTAKGLEASKLRSQIFVFVTWIARMGSSADLNVVAPRAIQGLREYISYQGWPDPGASAQKLSPAELSLRSLAYETIGVLAPKIDRASQDDDERIFDLDLLRWLFTSLSSDTSSAQIFVSIEQALGSILNALANNADEHLQNEIRPLLIHHMHAKPGTEDRDTGFHIVRSTRFAAVRFANRCLPYWEVQARWIDLMAIGGESGGRSEIIEEGQKGLDPYWYRMLNPPRDGSRITSTAMDADVHPRYRFPKFAELVSSLFGDPTSDDIEMDDGNVSLPTRFSSAYVNSFAPTIAFIRNILLCESFQYSGSPLSVEPDWEHRLDAAISTKEDARASLKAYLEQCDRVPTLGFLKASLAGLLWKQGQGLGRCGVHFVEICALASNDLLASIAIHASSLRDPIFSNNVTNQDIATQAFGILASHTDYPTSRLLQMFESFIVLIENWKTAVGQGINKCRGALLALTHLSTRASFRGRLNLISENQIRRLLESTFDILNNSRDLALREASHVTIGQLSLASILSPTSFPGDNCDEAVKKVICKLSEEAKKEKDTAILTLGRLSLVLPKDDTEGSPFKHLLKSLYELHEVKRPEVQFSVGEALCTVAVGWSSKSLITVFDVDAPWPKSDIPSHILSGMLDKIIIDCKASKPSLRKASVIWLLCLIQYCGHFSEVQDRLRKCQATFVWLLSDRDEVVQETGSRGLSLVYEMGSQDLKDDLVRDLVRSFTMEGSNLGGGKISTDTELFEPGALPTGEGSVTTYKDIVGLASEVGDPSLVYRFMSLASNNAIWSSRAAFGRFGLSNVLSDSSVNGYLAQNPKLFPKLYRYRFDPNPNVQRSMNDIWNALVKDSNSVIEANFDAIMDDLLKSIMTGKEWRVRQASCAAIGDLIQGRPTEKYDKYLGDILTKAFKLLDDIKATVRQAALRLCQVLTNIVVRSLEAGDADSKRARVMLNHIIPFLLSHEGMESAAEEVQGYAITTLTKIIKKSPGKTLRLFVPQILERFLASLSSLEPQAVNYIHLNADKYGLTGQDIDKMRLSAIRTSPMMEAIELSLLESLDDESMKEVANKLEDVLRSAIGLPSKVGVSRVLVILSSKTFLFRPHADRFVQLMRKHVLDRNDTISASYSSTIGYLMRLATDDQMLKTIEFAKSLYFGAEETSHRVISGEILNSISKLANDRVAACSAAFLPFIFVGMHDTEEQVRELFLKTWNDNVSGSRAVSLYLQEILDIVSNNLDSPRWAIKHTSALAVAKVASSLDDNIDLGAAQRIWPAIEKAVAGKTWEGKETVLEGFVKFSRKSKALCAQNSDIREQMKVIVVREARRNNPAYKPHALKSLAEFAKDRDDLDLMPDAMKIVSQVVEELVDDSKEKMEVDAAADVVKASKVEGQTLAASVECIFSCLNPSISFLAALTGHISQIPLVVGKAVTYGGKAIYGIMYSGLKSAFEKLGAEVSKPDSELSNGELNSDFRTALLSLGDQLLFRDLELSVEKTRHSRAQAALAYTHLCNTTKIKMPDEHRQQVKEWLATERSGPVQAVLFQVLEEIL
ncbi:proteasome component [Blastomyces gilchristii SLH14081]|uniref:Proteasome component n=1 Tax=Blastomyces gilchristii (strain SLH14081) TaxID=559298 RepID=A0A179UBD2_BLAGS|nr:proteasome component [Blastomyces gilchristii SLH14081]OAT05326.1 proteasome component [Blastomyces gilchristii SLH14081]